jgi:hypothetical protein
MLLQRNEARDPASNIGSLVNQIYKKSEKQLRSQSQATPPRNTAIPEGFGSPPKKELKSPHKKDPSSSVGQPATPEREKRKKAKQTLNGKAKRVILICQCFKNTYQSPKNAFIF